MTHTYEFEAIGTRWWLEILGGDEFPDTLKNTIQATAATFDQRYSRFRDDSLVSELYRTGKLSHPPAEMIRMLEFAHELYEVSGGAFDITVGNDLHRLGYGKQAIAREIDTSSFWNEIVITPAEIILPMRVMLDFGGFGKGWLIDMFVRDMRLAGTREFIVNGGGDLYVQSAESVELSLEDPYDATKQVGSIAIQRGALAGSNTIKRNWTIDGAQKHHIIDPASHDSSDSGVVASFVAASSALIADAFATILILRPELESALTERYGLQVMLIRDTDKATPTSRP